MAKSIVIIGAREGSKRVPNKNLKVIGTMPLIAYPISTALQLGIQPYVSTDSKEIATTSKTWGAEVIIRPKELAEDFSTDSEWILHFLGEYKRFSKTYPSTIVFLRPTTPLRDVSVVKRGIDSFKPNMDSLRSVEPLKEAIQKAFQVDGDALISAYPFPMSSDIKDPSNLPNQFFPTSYTANGYVDVLRTDYILDTESLYGTTQAYITPRVLEIDTIDDIEYADYLARKYYVC
jgi:CMP-N,N'-diacetyllegionaminic acid synthase